MKFVDDDDDTLRQQAAHRHSLTQGLLGYSISAEAAMLTRPLTSLLAVLQLTVCTDG